MFTYEDLLIQFGYMRRIGRFQELIMRLPGVMKLIPPEALEKMNDAHVRRIEAMVLSMTPAERRLQFRLSHSRRVRIARGSGATEEEVGRLETQMDDMQRNMRGWRPGGSA